MGEQAPQNLTQPDSKYKQILDFLRETVVVSYTPLTDVELMLRGFSMIDNLPPLEPDPVIEVYKRDVDVSLLRVNLQLSHEQRLEKLQQLSNFADELRKAGPTVKTDT